MVLPHVSPQIQRSGAIARDGRLREGQRLLEVNGQSLLGATYEEAVKALRAAGDRYNLLVCDGYDPAHVSGESRACVCVCACMYIVCMCVCACMYVSGV